MTYSSSPYTGLNRRTMLAGFAAVLGAAAAGKSAWGATSPRALAAWIAFRRGFLTPDGRIVDTGNRNVSHSEGQGIGLLSAACFGDQSDFDLILGWTQRYLSRPDDSLHSWCYNPNTANHVVDENNATDGDLLIGLALFTAADRWQNERYRTKGLAIARDVKAALLHRTTGATVLLPGINGFVNRDVVTVNPSYYVFPALQRFALELPDPVWRSVWNDGLALLTRARFGQWALSPDWVNISGRGDVRIADAWPARSSFDAVRVPLYLCWASLSEHPAVTSFQIYWQRSGGASAPAWSDLATGQTAPYQLSAGMDAIRRLANVKNGVAKTLDTQPITPAMDYYAAALVMLVHVAVYSSPQALV